MASLFGKIARGVTKLVTKNPIVKTALKAVPGVGLAYTAFDIGSGVFGGGGGGGAQPPMLLPPPGGMGAAGGMPYDPNMGKRSIFKNDPNVAERLKPYAIDNRFLRQFYRAPRGFVVLKDAVGAAFAIPKKLAMAEGIWKPAKKPPISVGDWSKLQGANRVVKKFRDMEKKAMRIANFHAPRHSRPQLKVYEQPGKAVVARRAA